MFIVLLRYVKPIEVVESLVQEHRDYLDRHYAAGHFVASGPQVPRVGGAILVQGLSRPELDAVLAEDPFHREQVAQYEVVEFDATKVASGFETLLARAR